MESKSLIISFTWIFVLVSIIALSWQEGSLTFASYMVFFVMALVATIAVEALIPGAQPAGDELRREVHELKTRLDELKGESA